jgi:hypothetical protein
MESVICDLGRIPETLKPWLPPLRYPRQSKAAWPKPNALGKHSHHSAIAFR